MKIFKSNWSKWFPLGNYRYATKDYVVFVKKNLKTGMLKFKVKSPHKRKGISTNPILPLSMINTQDQWDLINNYD
jgi:hypothetical protein